MSTLSSTYAHQAPIAVAVNTGSLHTALPGQSVTIPIPARWATFWDAIRPDFHDIAITDADGTTVLTYRRADGASHPNRSLTLEVSGWTAPSGTAVCLLWLHWGDPGAASDPATGPAISDPHTGRITTARPGGWRIDYQPPTVSTVPTVYTKRSDEVRHLWARFPMGQRRGVEQGSLLLEWPRYLVLDVTDDGDPPVVQPGMVDRSQVRFAGSQYARIALLGGVDGSVYTLTLSLTTNTGQRLSLPVQLRVRS